MTTSSKPCHQGCASGSTASGSLSRSVLDKVAQHPCYSPTAHHRYARMHLAVAPACNVQCHYCNRKFDCANESRPGVVSEVLTPQQAVRKARAVASAIPQLSVIGIAGPGDPLANGTRTFDTLEGLRQMLPDVKLCVSTNGLALPQAVDSLVELGVDHVTVTMNAIDAHVAGQIYDWIYADGRRLRGREAGQLLIDRQLEGMYKLVERGVLVKVNSVLIPGINDVHLPEVSEAIRDVGAFLHNVMPLISRPEHGTWFGLNGQREPLPYELDQVRALCGADMTQMTHCQQCRADAIGLLTQDRSAEFRNDPVCPGDGCAGKSGEASTSVKPFRVAVTSKYLRLVDQHFGHAERFLIYETDGKTNRLIEQRQTSKYCSGNEFCEAKEEMKLNFVKKLGDCDAVVTMRLGAQARARLLAQGIEAVESCESIDEALARTVEQLSIKQAG